MDRGFYRNGKLLTSKEINRVCYEIAYPVLSRNEGEDAVFARQIVDIIGKKYWSYEKTCELRTKKHVESLEILMIFILVLN